MVGLEPSWPGTILSIDLASPGPLLHPAKRSAALGGQRNPGLLSPRHFLLSLELTLALQLGRASVMSRPCLSLEPVQGEQWQQGGQGQKTQGLPIPGSLPTVKFWS